MKLLAGEDGDYFEFENQGQVVRVPVEFKPRRNLGGRQDLLARALGKKIRGLRILDLTAGLGRDAFHMAQLGADVTALERNRLLFEALHEAWRRAGRSETLRFINADAADFLRDLKEPFDVIFYDPMFPEKKKTALAGKESQLLQRLETASRPEEEAELVKLALQKSKERVVVKRPLAAPPILTEPKVVFKGKSVRYDVYRGGARESVE